MVDDSIVRGSTVGPLVKMLRSVGALEVHVRVSSPPLQFPCFMGTDIASRKELIGASKSPEEIRRETGADSLAHLSYEGMIKAVHAGLTQSYGGYCGACFTGNYPVPVDECVAIAGDRKLSFEVRR
jgi:amidophosphoribosyltransferase